jgi:hypothetical protein
MQDHVGRQYRGFSRASLEHIPSTSMEPAHARFHGSISIELPQIDLKFNGPATRRGEASIEPLRSSERVFGTLTLYIPCSTY